MHTSGDPGGSTITQQLATQLYGRGSGLAGTLQEIGLGVKISLNYPKQQILGMYLNVVYYGNGYWGDEAAARGYFGISPRALDWAQAAMLAGLPQAPSAYDPETHFALAKQRQRHVLDQLVANHILTGARANAAYRERRSSEPEYQRIANADANEPASLAGAGPTPVPFAYRRSCPPGTSRPRLD